MTEIGRHCCFASEFRPKYKIMTLGQDKAQAELQRVEEKAFIQMKLLDGRRNLRQMSTAVSAIV